MNNDVNVKVLSTSDMNEIREQNVSQTVNIASLALAIAVGVVIMSVAGHVQSATLHDAAHDVRHATGFPCH